MKAAFIFYHRQRVKFIIPDNWNLLSFPNFPDNRKTANVNKLTKDALNKPIQSSALNDLLSPTENIAIIIEDLTRTSPKRLILKVLLDNLNEIGIPEKNITIIIALGTHKGLTSEEMRNTFGSDILNKYDLVNHDCRAADLVPIGHLRTGAIVKINRKVYESSFKIGIGSIIPHPFNGFGGGGKIGFPGISDFDSILEHHMKWTFHEGTGLGKIDGNIFYEEIRALAKKIGLNFIINTILDQGDHVYEVVSGDPVKAHLSGIKTSKKIISQKFPSKSDLTIITSFPYYDGPQVVKPLVPASMVTKEGGCIILAADCKSNLTDEFIDSFESFRSLHTGCLSKAVMEHFNEKRLIMDRGAIDFNMALGITLTIQERFTIILVSTDIERAKAERMGFLFAPDLKQAFEMIQNMCPHPDVHIIPAGGIILPII